LNKSFSYLKFTEKDLLNLLNESKKGSEKAFNQLNEIVRKIAFSYFRSKFNLNKITNIEDVDDLTNNVCLAFIEQFRTIENIEFWLRRVMFFQFVKWYKNNNKRKVFEFDDSFLATTNNTNFLNFTEAKNAAEYLNKLREDKKQLIILKFWKGLKFKEIAEMLNKKESAVKKMFYRTLEELRLLLKD